MTEKLFTGILKDKISLLQKAIQSNWEILALLEY